MKTIEEIVKMQDNLRFAMMTLQGSGAPPEAIERSALALASAEDVLKWVLGRPSTLAELEAEYNRKREELHKN